MKKATKAPSAPIPLSQPVEPPKVCRPGFIESIPGPDKSFDRPGDPDTRVVLGILIAMQPHWTSGEDISSLVYGNVAAIIDELGRIGCDISEYRYGSKDAGVFYRLEALLDHLLPMRPMKGGL
jgi:hypothetical protein